MSKKGADTILKENGTVTHEIMANPSNDTPASIKSNYIASANRPKGIPYMKYSNVSTIRDFFSCLESPDSISEEVETLSLNGWCSFM